MKKEKVISLLIGRQGSKGCPGKNTTEILGNPLMYYPIKASKDSKYIDHHYVSTDSKDIKSIAIKNNCTVLDRPDSLCTDQDLAEDVFTYNYNYFIEVEKYDIEFLVILMCNAYGITGETIDKGIDILRADPNLDSAVTVSRYNMFSPIRARKINESGLLDPFVPFENIGNPKDFNCDRDSQGDVWFADMGVSIVRPRCIEKMHEGLLPQVWMGKNIYPLKQEAGLDLDYDWQFGQAEWWINNNIGE